MSAYPTSLTRSVLQYTNKAWCVNASWSK